MEEKRPRSRRRPSLSSLGVACAEAAAAAQTPACPACAAPLDRSDCALVPARRLHGGRDGAEAAAEALVGVSPAAALSAAAAAVEFAASASAAAAARDRRDLIDRANAAVADARARVDTVYEHYSRVGRFCRCALLVGVAKGCGMRAIARSAPRAARRPVPGRPTRPHPCPRPQARSKVRAAAADAATARAEAAELKARYEAKCRQARGLRERLDAALGGGGGGGGVGGAARGARRAAPCFGGAPFDAHPPPAPASGWPAEPAWAAAPAPVPGLRAARPPSGWPSPDRRRGGSLAPAASNYTAASLPPPTAGGGGGGGGSFSRGVFAADGGRPRQRARLPPPAASGSAFCGASAG